MAHWKTFTADEEREWREWLSTRPPIIQEMAAKYPPTVLYRLNGQHRVHVIGYDESGTLIVHVGGKFNRVLFTRQVFGVKPESLVECEMPAPGEDVGDTSSEAGYNHDDVRNILIPKLQEMRRHEQN